MTDAERIWQAVIAQRRTLSSIEDMAARRLAQLLMDLEREIATALQRGLAGPASAGRMRELINEINGIFESGILQQADWMQREIPRAVQGLFKLEQAQLGATGFSLETIRDSWNAWGQTDKYVELLNEGYRNWWTQVLQRNEAYQSMLQGELTRGMALGLDHRTIANALIDRGRVIGVEMGNPEVWARRLVRTETTRLQNDISVSFSEEMGLTLFWNLGIADERQSDICAEASEQEPMTMDEWAASEWGLPPRHPNCRCDLLAWSNDWGLDYREVNQQPLEEVAA